MESANVSTPTMLLADRAPAATSRQRVEVVTDLLRAELDTYGGDLRVLDLITYPEKLEAPDEPFRLLTDSGPDLYWAQNGLLGSQSNLPNHHTEYTATKKRYVLAEGKDDIEGRFISRAMAFNIVRFTHSTATVTTSMCVTRYKTTPIKNGEATYTHSL